VAEKKKKELTGQQIMIYLSLGLSVVVALKLFLPKKNGDGGNGRQQLSQEETQAYIAEMTRQSQQQLPQVPMNNPQQIPMMASQTPYIQNAHPMGAISNHQEEMLAQEQLNRIPIREEVGINNLFPNMGPMQNTVNPYKEMQNRNLIRNYNQPQSMHDFNRIMHHEDGVISTPSASQRPQQVSPRQSQYLSPIGYQSNPYASGNVV
jgi:hypothetical protein